jgi:hypothetical protein
LQPEQRLVLEHKEGQTDVLSIKPGVIGDASVAEGQNSTDVQDIGILFRQEGAGGAESVLAMETSEAGRTESLWTRW